MLKKEKLWGWRVVAVGGLQQQTNPRGYNLPEWFSGGTEEETAAKWVWFHLPYMFLIWPNKLADAVLKELRKEMIDLKRYFSLPIRLLIGAGSLCTNPPQNATSYFNKGFVCWLDVRNVTVFIFLYIYQFFRSRQSLRKYQKIETALYYHKLAIWCTRDGWS